MALTAQQGREVKRAQEMGIFYSDSDNRTIIDGYAPMKKKVAKFLILLALLLDVIKGKNEDGTWATDKKDDLKKKVAEEGALICSLTHDFAMEIGDAELASKTNFFYDNIYKLREEDVLTFATTLQSVVSPWLAKPEFQEYNVTQQMLDDVVKDATNFNGLIGVAQELGDHNTVDNTEINDVLKQISDNIHGTDRVISYFKKTQPKFVEGYELVTAIDHVGVRHSGFEGLVKAEDGTPLFGAVVRLKGTTIEAKTDIKGVYKRTKMKAGDGILEVFADDYVKQEVPVHISLGKILEKEFTLKKA